MIWHFLYLATKNLLDIELIAFELKKKIAGIRRKMPQNLIPMIVNWQSNLEIMLSRVGIVKNGKPIQHYKKGNIYLN